MQPGVGRQGGGDGFHGHSRSRLRDLTPPAKNRWQTILRTIRGTAAGVPRVLALVWRADRRLTVLMGVMTIAQAAVPASQVYLAKLLIDAVVTAIRRTGGAVDTRPIVILAILQLVLAAANSLFATLANISQQLLQERVSLGVQLMVMEQAARLDLGFFEDAASYDMLQQAQQEAASRPVQMVSGTFGLVRTALTFASMLGLLIQLQWLLALIALLAPIPAFVSNSRYGWSGYLMMRRQSPARRRMNYLTSLLTTDTYSKEIAVFTLAGFFTGRFRRLADEYYDEQQGLVVRRYMAGFFWGALTILVSSGTYLYVALLAVHGKVTLGDLTLYTGAATSVQSNFQSLLSGLSSMYENNLYLNTLFDLLKIEPTVRKPESPVPVARPFTQGIEFRQVSYSYKGAETPALHDLSFTIKAGETVAVVGRNGAGKTTLVKLIARLYDPAEGQVLIDGHDAREYDPEELRSQIGVIFQDYVTYFLSARENIGVGRLEGIDDLEAVRAAAARGGADSVIERLPEGYDALLGRWFEQGHQLSGGEWQKVALSRAFMREAQILILDEPTAALDAKAEHDLFARLRELTSGRTAIYISHRFSTVRMADRILVIEHGRLVEQGSHDELMALNGRYAELFTLQAAAYR
jgi:ATP-binding cassette subfamily B protein